MSKSAGKFAIDHSLHALQGALVVLPFALVGKVAWWSCIVAALIMGLLREIDQLRRSNGFKEWKDAVKLFQGGGMDLLDAIISASNRGLWHMKDRSLDILFHGVGGLLVWLIF